MEEISYKLYYDTEPIDKMVDAEEFWAYLQNYPRKLEQIKNKDDKSYLYIDKELGPYPYSAIATAFDVEDGFAYFVVENYEDLYRTRKINN